MEWKLVGLQVLQILGIETCLRATQIPSSKSTKKAETAISVEVKIKIKLSASSIATCSN